MEKSMAFSKVKGMIYIVIFLLLLTCIWKVLDEFSVLKNICGMAVARNGNGYISPFVNDSKFCRKLQWSQIVEFFSFNYLHACVEKNYRSF